MSTGPRLFSPTGAVEIDPGDGPGVDTPLGRLMFVVNLGGEPVPPAAAWQCGPYTVWRFGEYVECLLNPRLAVELPLGMRVNGAAAVVCRRRADEEMSLWYWFDDEFPGAIPTAVDHEALYTETFTDGGLNVTVGTPWPVGREPPGRGRPLPIEMAPGTRYAHITCAWGPDVWGVESTWLAVDRAPGELLAFE